MKDRHVCSSQTDRTTAANSDMDMDTELGFTKCPVGPGLACRKQWRVSADNKGFLRTLKKFKMSFG